jgi:lysyl-tRNA synthetase class 2
MQWQPTAALDILQKRAELMQAIRAFFVARHILEVETPIMARFGVSDPYLSNLQVQFRQQFYALQTSPEYHMKRLLAAGSGPIFQISRVFRDDELGRWHNPEFSLLEWYQLDCDHLMLLNVMDELLQTVAGLPAIEQRTYQQAFLDTCQIDPLHVSYAELQHVLRRFDLHQVLSPDASNIDEALFLLMSHVVEPSFASLDYPIALIDFPASQASLAQVRHGVAQRFEVYYRGVELANGFHELTDATLQAARFSQDNQARLAAGLPTREADSYLLAALEHGLPPCSGVALGLDRLLALMLNKPRLSDVLSFDIARA